MHSKQTVPSASRHQATILSLLLPSHPSLPWIPSASQTQHAHNSCATQYQPPDCTAVLPSRIAVRCHTLVIRNRHQAVTIGAEGNRPHLVGVVGACLYARARTQVPQLHLAIRAPAGKASTRWVGCHGQHPRLVPREGLDQRAARHVVQVDVHVVARGQQQPRVRGEGEGPHRLVVALHHTHTLARGRVKHSHGAVHGAARQAAAVRAVRHAQHKALPGL
mmetsp:Transcript_22951/g.58653  ORF Transcript_22951/g.58653 Transcript_22951/m.58653 type:complete len:220 (+) Transcript_22951:110-769(+)